MNDKINTHKHMTILDLYNNADDETKYMIKHTAIVILVLALGLFIAAIIILKILRKNALL